MVFKQVGSDTDSLINKFGLLNKSFANIRKDFTNGQGWRSFGNIVSSDDITNFEKFQKELQKGTSYHKAFNNNLLTSHTYIQQQASELRRLITEQKLLTRQYNQGKISQDQYNTALLANKAQISSLTTKTQSLTLAQKTSAIASKAMGVALNMALNIGVGLIINAIISGITKLVNSQKELTEQAVEAAEKYDEQAKSLQDLKQQYIDIVDSESDVAKKTEELNEWKKTLIETYGFEKAALENVNLEREKGLGLIEDEINKNRINSAETWLTDNNKAYEDAKKNLTSRNNLSENSVIPQANVVTQVTKDALNDFSDNFTDILKKFSISNPTKDNPLAQIKIKGNNTLQQYENLNGILNAITSVKVSKGLNDTEEKLYNALLEKQKAYKKVVTDDIKDIYETGNKYTNSIKLFNFETDSGINFENVTQETYKEFRDKFLESLNLGDKKDSTDFSLDVEQILLDMMPDFEKVYRGIEDSADKAVQNIEETTEISSEEASKSLEDLQKSYENLSKSAANYIKTQKSFTSALEEQEKHGQLSASTIQELTDAGYSQALVVDTETGAVTLNKQAYEQLNNEKKQAIKLEAEQQKSDLEQKYNDEQKAISDLTLEMKYANAERRTAIMLELSQHSQNMAEYLDMIDKINGSVASLDSPEFGSDKETKPKSVTDFEAEYARRQHKINMGRMKKDEEYYSWLLEAAHTAYDGLKDYESDLWKYEEEVYSGRKQLVDDFYDEQQKDFEDRISALEDDIDKAKDGKFPSLIDQSDIDALNEFNQTMQKTYGLGNVDLTKRPKVNAKTMRKAGYEADDDERATVYSSFDFMWQGDEENGKYVAVHYTPILPDGTVLDEKSLDEYLRTLVDSDDIIKADTKGIILKVDTDLDISDADIKSLETNNPTENIQNIIKYCDDWGVALHEVQADWLKLDDAVNNVPAMRIEDKFDYIRSAYQEIISEIDGRINEIVQGGVEGHEDDLKALEKEREEYVQKMADVFDLEIESEEKYINSLKDKNDEYYDDKIKKLKDEKSEMEKRYDAEIKKIDETIDSLQNENDEKKRANDIEKARQELENASKRTRQVYEADGTISYKQDDTKIKEAQSNLDDLMYEQIIDIIKDNKDTLNKEKDTKSDDYDNQIDVLTKQKETQDNIYDTLLKILEKYKDPDVTESDSNVWETIGKDNENVKITDKGITVKGTEIDTVSINGDKTKTDDKADDKDKTATDSKNVFEEFLKSLGMTEPNIKKYMNGEFKNNLNGLMGIRQTASFTPKVDKGLSVEWGTLTRKEMGGNVSFNGDIVIQNPVGNSDDLAKELALNLPNAFQKQMYTNLGR